ncbi:putative bifunctional diguanylate cyclase/phosphodiesterase [Bradyrhizobium sp.]|uniref:putative bifunctional diguanylate cyclase/phosphodiesterase n=1 Tax=Bradyrhizobium sp. TaxID=376 RepID=UPI002DFB7AF8|nr:EAL domain-containing protein [Bradyrhizobium sp.]
MIEFTRWLLAKGHLTASSSIHPVLCPLFIIGAGMVGVGLSLATFSAVSVREHDALRQDFFFRASNVSSMLQGGLDAWLDKITALHALMESSEGPVTRQQFRIFADELMENQRAMLSASWIPRVARQQRAAHEEAARRDGIAGYTIQSVTPQGMLTAAPERDEYFPVYYSTEQQTPLSVHGLNLADGGLREETLVRARDGDRMAASNSLTLQSGTGNRHGFFVVLPVYRYGASRDTVESRRQNLAGFVQGVFQLNTMIDAILYGLSTPVELSVYENDADAFPVHVVAASGWWSKQSARDAQSDLLWQGKLMVADRQWKLVARTSPGWPAPRQRTAWTLLIAGMLVTFIIVVSMCISRYHVLRLIEAKREASRLAQTDPLTMLANRRALFNRLHKLFAAGHQPFAIACIDLDNFKSVNDTLGHGVGDALLQQVSQRLRANVRHSDIIARTGGDEFTVVLSDVDLDGASAAAAKIIDALAEPYAIGNHELHVTASVGVSLCSTECPDADAIIVQADIALYRAKQDGHNCFRLYSAGLGSELQQRAALADELRGAICRDELELHFQPQVEISSGRIIGLEALVRWNHPARGMISPATFIPIAEETGIIVPLGRWVFDEACRYARLWQQQGIAPQAVGVNVSTIQCNKSDIARDFGESLKKWRVEPGCMEIELTESVLMEVTEHHCGIVERLRALGLRIAIDDFGTGYSSLSYLTNFPVDRLKIAQELVLSVDTDHRHASVVRTAIRLAKDLGIEIIAEGVETAAQARFLTSADCAYAQGYRYGRPVNAARATELLRQRRVIVLEETKPDTTLAPRSPARLNDHAA